MSCSYPQNMIQGEPSCLLLSEMYVFAHLNVKTYMMALLPESWTYMLIISSLI